MWQCLMEIPLKRDCFYSLPWHTTTLVCGLMYHQPLITTEAIMATIRPPRQHLNKLISTFQLQVMSWAKEKLWSDLENHQACLGGLVITSSKFKIHSIYSSLLSKSLISKTCIILWSYKTWWASTLTWITSVEKISYQIMKNLELRIKTRICKGSMKSRAWLASQD